MNASVMWTGSHDSAALEKLLAGCRRQLFRFSTHD
jgi:hypothetical protein